MTITLPRWLRMLLFVLLLGAAVGATLKGVQEATKPTTLKIAVGSMDGEVAKVMTMIGSRMAATSAPVRLTVIEKPTPAVAAEAFAAGETDLAIVRGDNDELAAARAIVQVGNLVVMVMVPPNSPIKTIGDLKGKTVGVLAIDINQRVLAALIQGYGFPQGSVNFVGIPLTDLIDPNRAKKYQAAIFVTPLADRYNGIVRGFFPAVGKAQSRLIEIDAAEAIAISNKYYESYDMPKGALRGAPPMPDDSMSTLQVPAFLVAKEKLSDDTAAALAKAVMNIRRELMGESPMLAQVQAPDDDKNAPIPIHPGAKAFFDGTEKTFTDKYGDWMFYGPIMLGAVGSLMAAVWKFLTADGGNRTTELIRRVCALIERSRKASSAAEMEEIDRECDLVMSDYLDAQVKGQINPDQASTLNLLIGHMENAIERRSRLLKDAGGRDYAELDPRLAGRGLANPSSSASPAR